MNNRYDNTGCGSILSQSPNMPPQAIKQPLMSLVYNDIDNQLCRQKELLEKLTAKLQPILSPNPTNSGETVGTKDCPQPMLVETFKEVHRRIRVGNEILESILNSIEI